MLEAVRRHIDWDLKLSVSVAVASVSVGSIGVFFNLFVPVLLQAQSLVERVQEDNGFVDENKDEDRHFSHEYNFSPGVAFFIVSLEPLINALVCPLVGDWSDRLWVERFGGRRKPFYMLAMPVVLFLWILLPFANSDAGVVILVILLSLAIAFPRPAVASYLADLFEPEYRSKAYGIVYLVSALIVASTMLVVGAVLSSGAGGEVGFIITAIVSGVACLVASIAIREKRERASDRAGTSASQESGDKKARPSLMQTVKNVRIVWNASKRCFLLLTTALFWGSAMSAVQVGVSSFAVAELGMDQGSAITLLTVFAVSFTLAALPTGYFAPDPASRMRTVIAGKLLLSALTMFVFLFVRVKWLFVIVLILGGILAAALSVNFLPLVYDEGGERRAEVVVTAAIDDEEALRFEGAPRGANMRSGARAGAGAAGADAGTDSGSDDLQDDGAGSDILSPASAVGTSMLLAEEDRDFDERGGGNRPPTMITDGAPDGPGAGIGADGVETSIVSPSAGRDTVPGRDSGEVVEMGALTGLFYVSISIASVIGPVLAGVFVELSGDFRAIFLFSSAMLFVSACITYIASHLEDTRSLARRATPAALSQGRHVSSDADAPELVVKQ